MRTFTRGFEVMSKFQIVTFIFERNQREIKHIYEDEF